MPPQSPAPPRCGACHHFDNSPKTLEAAFPGLSSMGSGYASVTASDGLCHKHGLYLPAHDLCTHFTPVHPAKTSTAPGPSLTPS